MGDLGTCPGVSDTRQANIEWAVFYILSNLITFSLELRLQALFYLSRHFFVTQVVGLLL